MNETVQKFLETMNVDIEKFNLLEESQIKNDKDVNAIISRFSFFKPKKENKKISIADVVGYDYGWRSLEGGSIINNLSGFFDKNGDSYHSRSVSMLDIPQGEVIKQLEKMPPEILIQMIESITGEPADENDSMALIQSIASLPDDKYKETMANIDPNVQMQLVYQMAHDDKRILEVFDNSAYVGMMQRLQKPDIVKSMIGLSDESLRNMMTELPPDLFAIVATQVDTKELAKFLMEDCQNVLEKLGSK